MFVVFEILSVNVLLGVMPVVVPLVTFTPAGMSFVYLKRIPLVLVDGVVSCTEIRLLLQIVSYFGVRVTLAVGST